MAATLSTDQFLDVLRKSKLVDQKRLDAFLQAYAAKAPPDEADDPTAGSRDLAQQLVRQGLLTHFQVGQLLAGKWKGFFLAGGKYKLMERLGAGGMGHVFLCEHVRMKRLVALKVLPTDKIKDDLSAVERFEREARAAAALDHPNIVRAHDIDTDAGKDLHFLVMEYVDGASLQEVVKKHGPVDFVRASHYIADAARGLQHAHEAGWVHRDIKPGNLLLDRAGTLRILDMGLARLFSDDTDNLTKRYEKNAVLGTADYLAPEQATNSSDVDIRADIYSLGATFYYLLTGRGPFDDGTVTQKLIWHQTRQPDPIRSLRPEVPKELEAVINKMMAKKAVHRYQEPMAIVSALEPWTSLPIEPPAEEEMPRLCPALLNYSNSGTSLSGMAGPPSTIRNRGRGGPRTAPISKKSLPRPAVTVPEWLKNKWVLIGVGAAALVLLGVGIALLMRPPKKDTIPPIAKGGDSPVVVPQPQPQLPPNPKPPVFPPVVPGELPPPMEGRLLVAGGSSGGRADVFPRLSAALEKAQPNQTITVLVPEIQEAVTVNAHLAGIRLESGLPDGQLVRWKPPADASADTPLLKLDSAGPAVVKGFEFDGAVRLNRIIEVTGQSGGMRLEDLYLTDSGKKSIVFNGAASTKDQPVTIERVRVTTLRDYSGPANLKSDAAPRPSAIECTESKAAAPLALAVRWCRFEGVFTEAVLIECPVDATFELNRFYTLKTDDRPDKYKIVKAVSIRNVSTSWHEHVSLVNNTMARFTHLLRIDTRKEPLPEHPDFQFVVKNNLVLGDPGDAWVFVQGQWNAGVAAPLFRSSGGNVCRPGAVAFNKQLPASVVPRKQIAFGDLDMNAGSDGFLRYKKTGDTAALMTAGMDGGPVGVPPLD